MTTARGMTKAAGESVGQRLRNADWREIGWGFAWLAFVVSWHVLLVHYNP